MISFFFFFLKRLIPNNEISGYEGHRSNSVCVSCDDILLSVIPTYSGNRIYVSSGGKSATKGGYSIAKELAYRVMDIIKIISISLQGRVEIRIEPPK